MESKKNIAYYEIIKKIKNFCVCKLHTSYKYTAYCSVCMLNICDKCLSDSTDHIGHEIFYFKKLNLLEKQIKYYQTIFFLCKYYLNRIRDIVVELLSDLNDIIDKTDINSKNHPLLLNLKSKLKNTYKHFYKINIYQMHYAKNTLSLYFYCRKCKYINYQILKNIYNVKINSVKIPELEEKEIFTKIQIMIDFMKNNNNNILKSSDSEHPSTFYSYIEYNSSKTPKVNTYCIKLSSISFDISKGEIYEPNQNDNNITIDYSIETNDTDTKEINNEFEITTQKDNKENKENISSSNENITNNNNIITYKINQIEEENNNINKYNINENVKIQKYQENQNNQNIIKIKNEEEEDKKDDNIKYNQNSTNKDVKNYIYSSLPISCGEEVEYRNNIQYIYFDKNEKREIHCVYYGEYKKGTLERHGRGLFIWEDEEYYLGYWANDKREGKGTNTYKNGNVYIGHYKKGKKHGDGIYEWKNGDKYEGEFKNDMKDGKGIYYYSNGDIYDGYFKMDKIDGNGTYTWANKISYKGLFKNNLVAKKGCLTYSKDDLVKINKIKIKINKSKDNNDYGDIIPSIDIKK